MLKKLRSGVKRISRKANELAVRTKCAVECKRAEGYVDSGVKILIAVVIGALLLTGLYTLINEEVFSPVFDRVANFVAFEP